MEGNCVKNNSGLNIIPIDVLLYVVDKDVSNPS